MPPQEGANIPWGVWLIEKHCKAYHFGGCMSCVIKRTSLNDLYIGFFCARSCRLVVVMIASMLKFLVVLVILIVINSVMH